MCLGVAVSGVGATAASATQQPAAATHAVAPVYRLTAAEVPATDIYSVDLYYGTLSFNTDPIGDILGVVAIALAIWFRLSPGKVSSGKDKGDAEVEIDDSEDTMGFNCLYAYSEEVKAGSCGQGDLDIWIEVPTGASFALESLYYYDKTGLNNNMITSHSTGSPNTLYLAKVITGGEDLRVWYFDNGIAAPVSPSPRTSPTAAPTTSPTPTLTPAASASPTP